MTVAITNTRGNTVATLANLALATVGPLKLVGKGYAGYGKHVSEDLYRITENFASDTPPASPIQGQHWYAPTANQMSYWDGSAWVVLGSSSTMSGALLSRLAGASSINFATTGSANVHTGAAGKKTYITSFLLIPQAGAAPTGANIPSCSLEVTSSSGDVCDKVTLLGLDAATKFYYYNISGSNRIVQAADTVKFVKNTAISSGTLVVDLYLFGHVR